MKNELKNLMILVLVLMLVGAYALDQRSNQVREKRQTPGIQHNSLLYHTKTKKSNIFL